MKNTDHGAEHDAAEGTRLIRKIIDETLSEDGFLMTSRDIEVPDYLTTGLDAKTIHVKETSINIFRPDTDEHTQRSLFIFQDPETGNMQMIDVAVPRDMQKEVSPDDVKNCRHEFYDLLEAGEHLGLIDPDTYIEKVREERGEIAAIYDRFVAATLILKDADLADKAQAEIEAKWTVAYSPPGASLVGDDAEVNAWVEAFLANQERENELGMQQMQITFEYATAAMKMAAGATLETVGVAKAWEVQRLIDQTL